VLDESLTILLVLVDIIEIALCVVLLSELNDDDEMMKMNLLVSISKISRTDKAPRNVQTARPIQNPTV